MDLDNYLDRMKIPNHDRLWFPEYGPTDLFGIVTFTHKPVQRKKSPKSNTTVGILSLVKLIRDNPIDTYKRIYELAENQHNFPDHSSIDTVYQAEMQLFRELGVIEEKGLPAYIRGFLRFFISPNVDISKFGLADSEVRYSYNEKAAKAVQVVSSQPNDLLPVLKDRVSV